jgi:quinol---cytochrome c reductase iron-sulfur subunit, bacillus type
MTSPSEGPAIPPAIEPEGAGGDEDDPVAPASDPDVIGPGRLSRRSFVVRATAAIGALTAAIVGIPVAAFGAIPFFRAKTPIRLLSDAVAPTLRSEEWTSAGAVDDFEVGVPRLVPLQRQVTDGWTTETATVAVYVVRETEADLVSFDIHCTHLGCPLAFSSGAGQFVCPCHGGTFSIEGQVTGGPPPHPMLRYETRVVDGEIQVGPLEAGA